MGLDLTCTEAAIDGCFAELIREAHATSGQRAVVLVDEYDKPILDNLTRPEAAAIRDGLRNLYSVIKDSDADNHGSSTGRSCNWACKSIL